MAYIFLLKIVCAHLLTDFVLQPSKWVEARKNAHHKAIEFYWHIGLTGLVVYLFMGVEYWRFALAIMGIHGVIDWLKSYMKDSVGWFIFDQALHFGVLMICWWLAVPDAAVDLCRKVLVVWGDKHVWIYGTALLFLTYPAGIAIGKFTEVWRRQVATSEERLDKAGKWIGMLERILIFCFVMLNQYEAIGFLTAAKSILRFKESEAKHSEYVLIGTLISVATAFGIGLMVKAWV
jgi:Protein of unknown function (DUF3307)